VPAAAVIPAPIAYIKVVAVKKLVVGFLAWGHCPGILVVLCVGWPLPSFRNNQRTLHWAALATPIFYFEKIRVFKAGFPL